MPGVYILSQEMHNELLKTFEAARDRALSQKDEDSASYYWGLVEYLQGMPKSKNLRDLGRLGYLSSLNKVKKEEPKKLQISQTSKKENVIKNSDMSLKQVADWLRRDSSLSVQEKFELYYDEHLRVKEKKESRSYKKLIKDLGLDKNEGKKNGS